jgi:LemA protein
VDTTFVSFVLFLGALVALGGWSAVAYNRLIRLRNRVDATWADVDVQLQRRHDLVPNLVAVVKGYASHEHGTLDDVIAARTAAVAAEGPHDQAHAENVLTSALGRLFANAEAYPDLKADESFEELQERLETIESTIAFARQAYNLSVQAYANATQTIPTNFVAWFSDFEAREFLSADAVDRESPHVDLPPAAAQLS